MSDIKQIAKDYIDAGWAVVPVNAGKKKAEGHKWQAKTYAPANFKPDDNLAGKCGEPSGWRVDVDCDAPEAVQAAAMLLPHTGLVHGRPGKPQSHWWFISEGMKTSQFTDVKDAGGKNNMLVEIRSTGGYTVLPPSIWTDKEGLNPEVIAWEHERSPMTMTPDGLYEAVRNVAIAALLARHWPGSGARHAMVGHLTGFLLQGGVDAGMVGQIVKAAATIAKDQDVDDRVKYANNTIGKFAAGENVTGGPKLAEAIGEAVVAKMRAWLRIADADAIEAMNVIHFWTRLGKDDVIGREDDDNGVIFQRPKSLYSEYANVKVQTGTDDDGEPIFKPLFPEWLEHPTRRTFKGGVVFLPPPLEARKDQYNLWKGFALDPVEGSCQRFLDHLHEVICSGNDDHYRYLLKLCAYTLQFPGIASEVATVLRGEPGTGKGTFIRVFQRIFGRRHFAHLDRVKDLVDFNALISGKIIVFADEAFWAGDKREIGALKRIITEPTLRITRKGIDSSEETNCIHLFMATNEEWSVPAQLKERRFLALNVSAKHRQDGKYFDAIEKELSEGGAAAFLHQMLMVPVTASEVRSVPKTRELRVQQDQSMRDEQKWWQECLWEGRVGQLIPWGTWAPTDAIYDQYEHWLSKHHKQHLLTKIDFGRRILKLASAGKSTQRRISGERVQAWEMRTLEDARQMFDVECETQTDWPEAQGASSTPF